MCPQKSLQFVSILGAGLLCGTALAITIPEGVGLLEDSWKGKQGTSNVHMKEKKRWGG